MRAKLILFAIFGAVVTLGVYELIVLDRDGSDDACPPPSHTVEFHCTVDDPAVARNRAVKEQIEVLRNTEGGVDGD